MLNIDAAYPMEMEVIDMEVLEEKLGPVGMAEFIQRNAPGYGDYTKEKQSEKELSLEEIDALLKRRKHK